MAPVKHTVGSAIGSTAGEAAVNATGYGVGGAIIGGVAGLVIVGGLGLALGALAGPMVGSVIGGTDHALEAITKPVFQWFGSEGNLSFPNNWAEGIAKNGASFLGKAGALIGGVGGALGGLTGGGLLGGFSGIFSGSERIREEDQQYLDLKRSHGKKGPNPEHAQLAEKYAAAGYVQAMTDMQSMADAQMQQMAMMQSMQEQANAKAKQDFAAKLGEKHKCCKHTQRAEVAKAETNAATQLG